MTHPQAYKDAPLRVSLSLASRDEAPAEARRALEPLAPALTPRAYADLRFVVSELVGNSVKHAPGRSIDLWVERNDQGKIEGAVADHGNANIAIREQADPLTGGLGMRIVDALTERWRADSRNSRVWFQIAPAS